MFIKQSNISNPLGKVFLGSFLLLSTNTASFSSNEEQENLSTLKKSEFGKQIINELVQMIEDDERKTEKKEQKKIKSTHLFNQASNQFHNYNDTKKSLFLLEKALEIFPENDLALNLKGDIYLRTLKNPEEALESYQKMSNCALSSTKRAEALSTLFNKNVLESSWKNFSKAEIFNHKNISLAILLCKNVIKENNTGDKVNLARAYSTLASVYQTQAKICAHFGNSQKQLKYMKKCINKYQEALTFADEGTPLRKNTEKSLTFAKKFLTQLKK